MKSKNVKRRIVIIYWAAAVVLLPNAAYAYIDPATTTYLIQIATALVVMAGVSLTVFLYRFRTISQKIKFWFYGRFYRAANAENPAEEDTEPFSMQSYAMPGTDAPPELTEFDESVRPELENGRLSPETKKDTYGGRLKITIPLAIALSFTFIVVGCLELAVRHAPEIPFQLSLIVPYVILACAAVTLLIIFIVPIFKKRVFGVLLAAGLSVLVAGYIQGNYLNRGIGALTGDAVIWSDLGPQFAASLICWAGSFIIIALLWVKAPKTKLFMLVFIPLLLILLQSVSFASVINDTSYSRGQGAGNFWKNANETLTIDRINEVSVAKNAVIIALDRLDQEFVEAIEPEFFDPLDGFTRFDDFIHWYAGTFPSVPAFLTGIGFQYDMPRDEYFSYAWENAAFMHALKERGIDVRLYMDRGFSFNYVRQLAGIPSNTFEGELGINKRIALVKLLKLSGYRYAPMPLKPAFWFSPNEFIDTLELTDKTFPYITDDFRYYDSLVTERLHVSDEWGSLMYIHLQGSHLPFVMDENIQKVPESDVISQTKGAFRIVFEYLNQLKELGLYEDTLIIIMGDHGNYLGDEITRPAHTALFVKPAGSAGSSQTLSHAPVSPDQLHATIMYSLFGDTGGFGDTFFDINEGDDIVRHIAINRVRYEIRGDGRDFVNWRVIEPFPDNNYW